MQRHILLTDAVACFGIYVLLGGTLVALFASAFMGVMVSIVLALQQDPRTAALMDKLVEHIHQAKDSIINFLANAIPVEASKPTETLHE